MLKTITLVLLCFAVCLSGQNVSAPSPIQYVTVTPSGACGATGIDLKTPNGTLYTCQSGMWAAAGGGGGASPAGSPQQLQFNLDATHFGADGLLNVRTASMGERNLDIPTFASPSGGGGTFQNFLNFSECLDCAGASWVLTNASIGGATFNPPTNDPSGTGDTDIVSSMAGGFAQQCFDTAVAMTGRTFTYSVWVKVPAGSVTSRMLILSNTPTTAVSQTIAVTALWQRVSVTGAFGADAGTQVCAKFIPVDGGTGTVYAWGHQLEEGDYPSVYIGTYAHSQFERAAGFALHGGFGGLAATVAGFGSVGNCNSDCVVLGPKNYANNTDLYTLGGDNVADGGSVAFQLGRFLRDSTSLVGFTMGWGITAANPLLNNVNWSMCFAMHTDTCSFTIGDAGGTMGSLSPITALGQFRLGSDIVNPFLQTKNTQTATAPGAGKADLRWLAGTNMGTCKLVANAGTSATEVTIVDNVGGGC